MQQRLLACGMRPINNVVDVTNYVLLEYGQPLHAFDFHRIVDQKIIVRRAREGERIITLDGVERALSPGMLLITDPLGHIAIAGVMGGAGSEVSEETSAVLLESANFNPVSLRRTSRELRLRTEASLRFEKGLSPELPLPALRRATQLILELAGGEAAAGIIDVYPGRREREPILLTASQVKALLGIEVSQEQIITVLESLGFACQEAGDSRIWVRVPYWRSDVNLAADLAEEVARIIGYDQIPVTMLSSPLPPQQPDPLLSLREKVRDILAGCGLQEVITYSLTSREKLEWISPSGYSSPTLRLANPMSTEQELLRTTLRPGLLSTLAANQRHEPSGIRIFEVGKIYLPREKDLPREQEMVAAVLSGPRLEPSWFGEQGWLDFFDAKGVVETLLQRLGVSASFESSEDASFHPGKRARIVVKGTEVGVVGELHPQVAENFDLLPRPVSLLEIELEKLLPLLPARVEYKPLPRFPSSVRDLAIVVDREVPAGKIQDIISSFPLVSQVVLFDLYTGEPVPPGKKSLAFRITYQSPTHTLTDEEVHHTQQEILTRLEQELGATLRQ
jgi:phenylalanyl-tRNA synthetase beta chain